MRILIAASILTLSLPAAALAYERTNAISLTGNWEFVAVPPLKDIVKDRAAKPDWPTLAPALQDVVDPAARPPMDAAWRPIAVPSAWEQVAGIDYNGAGWYRLKFEAPQGWDGDWYWRTPEPNQQSQIESETRSRVWIMPNIPQEPDYSDAGDEYERLKHSRDRVSGAGQRIAWPPQHCWLEFDASACATAVYLNDEYIGGHIGDFSRWRLDLTSYLQSSAPGELNNELLVYVDELPGHITQGFLNMIAPHHGGIWQDVRLYVTGPRSILPDGVHVQADPGTGDVKVTATLTDISASDTTTGYWIGFSDDSGLIDVDEVHAGDEGVSIDEAKGTLTYTTHIEGFELWSPEHPKMYEVEVSTGPGCGMEPAAASGDMSVAATACDTVRQSFAFRDIHIEGSDLLLNGKPVNFRSALNWGAYPRLVSPTPPPQVVRDEFTKIKAMGFNAETVCLIILPDYYYDIADEMGILLWQEYPTWHDVFDSKDRETYVREFASFFRRDRHHPSIILRSMSCEAGVAEDNCMAELYFMGKAMTDTPCQDNTSWFWLSNHEIADWYDEHNYYTNAQWEKYLCETLPKELDSRPPKPFLIGESILFSTWPDTDKYRQIYPLQTATEPIRYIKRPGPDLPGTDEPSQMEMAPKGGWPYWFPRCMDSVVEWEAKLRARYNAGLPEGKDIVRDYLMPQSYDYALASRRFQIELMHMDPRYTGYTINVVREMPLIRAGLLDDWGEPRWTPEQWSWHGEHTQSPITPGMTPEERFDKLSAWKAEWNSEIYRDTPALVLEGGYRDLHPLLHPVNPDQQAWITSEDTAEWFEAMRYSSLVISSVLTNELVDYMDKGGQVLLLASKWPGGFQTVSHMYWRDQPFVPPVGPWTYGMVAWPEDVCSRVLELQPYDLTHSYSQVIPVDQLGITDEVDPLIRLFDSHDQPSIEVFDQVFATRVGKGLLVVSSLDHSTPAGQWVLGRLAVWANYYDPELDKFPVTSMTPDEVKKFAVARVNGIMGLEDGWLIKFDPEQQGEALGYMQPGFDASAWEPIKIGGWEWQGHEYNGMAWYRIDIDAPLDWEGAKLRLIADGVDDAYTVWVNGEAIATHGSFTDHEATVWLQQTVTDLTGKIIPGQKNSIVLQVVDITGQGGIWKPIYIAAE